MSFKFSTFTKAHPLKMISFLSSYKFKPVLFKQELRNPLPNRTVIILLSLFDLPNLVNSIKAVGIRSTRVIIFSSDNEIKFFPEYLPFLVVNKKKDVEFFLPRYIQFKGELNLPHWHRIYTPEPISDLNSCINFSKKIRGNFK